MGRKRAQEPEKHANHERWLLTYADLITLLMIFFILMYTISNVNSKKFSDLAGSLNQALVGQKSPYFVGESNGQLPIKDFPTAQQANKEQQELNEAQKKLEAYIKAQGLQGKVEVGQEERGLVISLKETLLFALGSAELNPQAKEVIKRVGAILVIMGNNVRIEGNTDNLPIRTHKFLSNWELSTTRATNVVQHLINSASFPPHRLSATGYGEYRPLVPNTSEVNRARNRRVDIVVMKNITNFTEPKK